MMNHISKELIGSAAAFFKVLGDETRMKILCTIADSEVCVNDIAEAVDMTKSAVSHQLKLLKDDDLVKSRREGKTFFTLSTTSMSWIFWILLSCISRTKITQRTVPAPAATMHITNTKVGSFGSLF